jgi:hypothetical protein
MHSFRFRWGNIIEGITAKPFSDFLSFNLLPVAWRCLSCRVGEVIAMPAALWPITKRVQLLHSAPAVTNEIESLAPKPPRDLLCTKNLVRQVNEPVTPRLRPNA